MLEWPTVFGHFHLWLKVGLYLSIEPESAGPHNPHWEADGAQISQACFLCRGVCLCQYQDIMRLAKVENDMQLYHAKCSTSSTEATAS